MENLSFTLPEVLSLLGVVQCVYVFVHVAMKAGKLHRVFLPMLYFFVLGTAFFVDFARGYVSEISSYYDVISWCTWMLITPLSVLFIIHMSHIFKLPSLVNWLLLFLVPLALGIAILISQKILGECKTGISHCDEFYAWLNVCGVIAGSVSLLAIWTQKDVFSDVLKQKAGRERYWLIISLVLVNICFLIVLLMSFAENSSLIQNTPFARTILGLGFVYLVSTSLFRIYPSALHVPYQKKGADGLNEEELVIANKLDDLLKLDKIYQEATYSRSDLAQELAVAEATVSKIISLHYKKSFPQLLNEYRVEDAKQLLLDTDASIKVVAEEVGFNSLPSFNRVFKEISGQSPSAYRKNMIK